MLSTNVLSKIKIFEGIPERFLSKIVEISEELSYRKGKSIFAEGSEAEHVHILLEGEVSIQVSLTSRSDHVTVAVITEPYMCFGWSGAVPPHIYTASAICEADCRLLAIQGEKLIRLLQDEPGYGFMVLQKISELISRRLRSSRIALLKTL
jgi:CRP-like cAMP-binding protein